MKEALELNLLLLIIIDGPLVVVLMFMDYPILWKLVAPVDFVGPPIDTPLPGIRGALLPPPFMDICTDDGVTTFEKCASLAVSGPSYLCFVVKLRPLEGALPVEFVSAP